MRSTASPAPSRSASSRVAPPPYDARIASLDLTGSCTSDYTTWRDEYDWHLSGISCAGFRTRDAAGHVRQDVDYPPKEWRSPRASSVRATTCFVITVGPTPAEAAAKNSVTIDAETLENMILLSKRQRGIS